MIFDSGCLDRSNDQLIDKYEQWIYGLLKRKAWLSPTTAMFFALMVFQQISKRILLCMQVMVNRFQKYQVYSISTDFKWKMIIKEPKKNKAQEKNCIEYRVWWNIK